MLRNGLLIVLWVLIQVGFLGATGNLNGLSDFFPTNSTVSQRSAPGDESGYHFPIGLLEEGLAGFDGPVSSDLRILMFDYSAYDSVYAGKLQSLIKKNLPQTDIKTFWNGSSKDLEVALSDRQLVVLPYPSVGETASLQAFGWVLRSFVKNGGTLIFTGTHDYEVLRQFGFMELDYGYFFSAPSFKKTTVQHPISAGIPDFFDLSSYAYPLDISDPDYVSLAEVNGYSAAGYKTSGSGVYVYLGMEYYKDESISSRYIVNAITWGGRLAQKNNLPANASASANNMGYRPKRVTLRLTPSDIPANETVNLKIYPNPFVEKCELDIAIAQSMPVSVVMTDQVGRMTWNILPRKTLAPGRHILELPNVPLGVYFVTCKCGDTTMVKKIVKTTQ